MANTRVISGLIPKQSLHTPTVYIAGMISLTNQKTPFVQQDLNLKTWFISVGRRFVLLAALETRISLKGWQTHWENAGLA